MTGAIRNFMGASCLALSAVVPLAAAPLAPEAVANGAPGHDAHIFLAKYGDGTSTSPRHGRRNHSAGAASKTIEPYHADMHGATRESADKAYRKQYGF